MPQASHFALRALILAIPLLGICRAEEKEGKKSPQVFRVSSAEVLVRSGPGEDFYATSMLKKGSEVQVYRVDQGDWAAIRPPEGSFSWIEFASLQRTTLSDVARVSQDETRTRVGSRFTKDRQVAYVTLRRGERVKLLEGFPADDENDGGSEWLKIAPVAGEFRWVPLEALTAVSPQDADASPESLAEYTLNDDHVSLSAPQQSGQVLTADELTEAAQGDAENLASETASAPKNLGEESPAVVRAQWSYDLSPRTYADKDSQGKLTEDPMQRPATPPEQGLSLSQAFGELRQAVNELNLAQESTADRVAENRDLGLVKPVQALDPPSGSPVPTADLLPAPSGQNGLPPPLLDESTTSLAKVVPSESSGGSSEAAIQESLRITAELSQILANSDATTWSLSPLRSRAEAVVDTAGSAEIRQNGQELIARIAQFEDIQRRHRQLGAAAATLARNKSVQAASENALARTTDASSTSRFGLGLSNPKVDGSQYDGYGWLMPVATSKPNSPRYVLTDNEGNILQFVTPRPGMNLRRYERKRVGIYGERGFLPTVNQPILTAERVISVDRVR